MIVGMPRSATSFVGRVLSAAQGVSYIEEPLMHLRDIEEHYPYYECRNSAGHRYGEILRKIAEFEYLWSYGWRSKRGLSAFGSRLAGAGARQYRRAWLEMRRAERGRMLLREPHGSLLALGAVEELDFRVLVLVRHPASFVASMQSLGWTEHQDHPASLLRQEDLVRDHLPWLPEILAAESHLNDSEIPALLWKCVYASILSFQQRLSSPTSFLVVRHEDFGEDSAGTFERIFEWADLEFRSDIRELVGQLTSSKNPVTRTTTERHQHGLKRNSREVVSWWKDYLRPDQVEAIKSIADPTWKTFYDEDSWKV
jgi:hypothetical protein